MQADHDISKGGNPCCAGYARVDCSYVERGSVRGCANAHCSRVGILVERRNRWEGTLNIEEAKNSFCYKAKICRLDKKRPLPLFSAG